jgi:hypothetical protein
MFAAGYDSILNIEKSCNFKLAVTPNNSSNNSDDKQ